MKFVAKFFSLSAKERLLLLKLFWYLLRAETVLTFLPYSAARRVVFTPKPVRSAPPLEPLDALYRQINLLKKLTCHLPWKSTCLRQAVALRDALAAQGIDSTLKLGLLRTQDEFEAHAWLECCGMEVLKNRDYNTLV